MILIGCRIFYTIFLGAYDVVTWDFDSVYLIEIIYYLITMLFDTAVMSQLVIFLMVMKYQVRGINSAICDLLQVNSNLINLKTENKVCTYSLEHLIANSLSINFDYLYIV